MLFIILTHWPEKLKSDAKMRTSKTKYPLIALFAQAFRNVFLTIRVIIRPGGENMPVIVIMIITVVIVVVAIVARYFRWFKQ